DMHEGAEVRKAVPMGGVGDMLAGFDRRSGGAGAPQMFGDFGLKRNTEGQTSREAVASLGLDYEGAPYVKTNADGTKDFSDDVTKTGVMMIDSTMTKEMQNKAQVPLGHDVMAEAQTQAEALRKQNEGKAPDEQTPVPPLLQTDAAGKMTHAFERNRTSGVDP